MLKFIVALLLFVTTIPGFTQQAHDDYLLNGGWEWVEVARWQYTAPSAYGFGNQYTLWLTDGRVINAHASNVQFHWDKKRTETHASLKLYLNRDTNPNEKSYKAVLYTFPDSAK